MLQGFCSAFKTQWSASTTIFVLSALAGMGFGERMTKMRVQGQYQELKSGMSELLDEIHHETGAIICNDGFRLAHRRFRASAHSAVQMLVPTRKISGSVNICFQELHLQAFNLKASAVTCQPMRRQTDDANVRI